MTGEEKLLLARCEDLFSLCDKRVAPCFTDFLNEAEQTVIKNNIGNRMGYNSCFFGGYENSQRKIFGVFPQWEEPDFNSFPIKVLKITKNYKRELTHRDYLGTVLSCGIDRIKVGDILIDGDCAYIFISEDIADYVSFGIDKIANVGVKAVVEDISKITPPEPKFEVINTVSASVRLDAVIASVLNLSRKNACELIKSGRVCVNYTECTNTSHMLSVEDIISARGFGKFIFSDIGQKTRSDRLHIEVKKYI